VLAIQNEREWHSFCRTVLKIPAMADDPRFASNSNRCVNRPALNGELTAVFAKLTGAELVARLKIAAIAYASLNDIGGLSAHSQLRRIEVATPTGPATVPAPPALINGQVQAARSVPGIGEHNAAIRTEFAAEMREVSSSA
jgi:crotonobetainyl-CoA:carnitine CoA-transferase CaiB-like acyl-CoA transferase